jgi:3-oxoacyl-[acyl-carrier-protein] synthase-3
MNYSRVFVQAIGYELPTEVVTSSDLESRLRPMYEALRIPEGQLEALTGIVERRWWEPGYPVSQGALAAARKALARSPVRPEEVEALIYAGVCRDQFEPATACSIAAGLGVNPAAAVYDLSNACLGVLNGMLDIANRIELGQIRAGLVVSCESAREINDTMIERMLVSKSMDLFRNSLATLTGGSGAAAVLLTDGSFDDARCPRLLGGVTQTAPEHHRLCRWGLEAVPSNGLGQFTQVMATDSIGLVKYSAGLGQRTWVAFLDKIGWTRDQVDKIICHQVGAVHHDLILKTLDLPAERDFSTFPCLGNMGTVSLPVTAALAEEREFLRPGDRVGFLGLASGMNCLMLGIEW